MSDLNVRLTAPGFLGVNREGVNEEVEQDNITNRVQVDQVDKELVNKSPIEKETTEKENELLAFDVAATIEEMNSFLQNMKRNLSFSLDEASGEKLIIVKDSESDEVIRQIPSEELLVLRKKMDDVVGILFDIKV